MTNLPTRVYQNYMPRAEREAKELDMIDADEALNGNPRNENNRW